MNHDTVMSHAGGGSVAMTLGTVLAVLAAAGSVVAALYGPRAGAVRLAHLAMAAAMAAMLLPTTLWVLVSSVAVIAVASAVATVPPAATGARACRFDLAAMAVVLVLAALHLPGPLRVGAVVVVCCVWVATSHRLRRAERAAPGSSARRALPRVETLTVVCSAVAMSAMCVATA